MEKNNTMLKLEMGALITVIYALLQVISNQYMIVPQVVGLRLMNLLPIAVGLLFGRVGAFGCALGSLFGDAGSGLISPLSLGGFLGAYGAAYVPFRIWQGMRSEREEYIALGSTRTNTMFMVLAFIAAIPPSIVVPLFADRFGLAAYNTAFGPLILQNVIMSVVFGTLLYKYISPRFLVGVNHELLLLVKDDKTSTRPLSVALLRLSITACFVGLGFLAIMPAEIGQNVIMYTMGILSVVILILANW